MKDINEFILDWETKYNDYKYYTNGFNQEAYIDLNEIFRQQLVNKRNNKIDQILG